MATETAEMEFLKVITVARQLETTPSTIYRWIREGKLGALVLQHEHNRFVRVPRAELERLLGQAVKTAA